MKMYGTLVIMMSLLIAGTQCSAAEKPHVVFCCAPENDLYRAITAGDAEYPRYESAAKAIDEAPEGAGVLILADGYPKKTTPIEAGLFDRAAKKKLRLYVEYPASLPDLEIAKPRRTRLERAVVASDAFGESLKKMRLLAIHDCHFVEAKGGCFGFQVSGFSKEEKQGAGKATDSQALPETRNPKPETLPAPPHLVLATVAGYDTAAYGLAGTKAFPLLFEHPRRNILVCTTKLSQFVTARYAPKEALQAVWRMVFAWLQPGRDVPALDWTPVVRPTYCRDEKLPPDAVRKAIIRGIDWHTNARMLIGSTWNDEYKKHRRGPPVGPAPDPAWPAGDGRYGILEGVQSTIQYDGSQLVRWWLRSDSNGESALAFALRSKLDGDKRSARIAANLLDWVYFKSGLFQKEPAKAEFGLIHWAPDSGALYGDNDIKIMLSCMGTAALLKDDRWNESLLQNITANFRTTGRQGFRGGALQNLRGDWRPYYDRNLTNYAPHYEAWIWASYLWAYDKTKDPVFLERTRKAVCMMMEAYPDRWTWTNGIQQERGRMLLTLAWLIRVEDKPQYRQWLKQLATDMRKCQDASGGIREALGDLRKGRYRPPRSNAEYGKHEASAIHETGDPMADMLYTCNFTFLGLHEAYAATGDKLYKEMADKLEEFFVRIQVRSDAHPELDGAWFRCFDYDKWDYWGANADAGWGAWSVEVGWTQAWIPSVLAMRELKLNLWDLTKNSTIDKHWKKTRATMLPDKNIKLPEPKKITHDAEGKGATLAAPVDPQYPGRGAVSLTDGCLGPATHTSAEWLGFEGRDLTATIDLGKQTDIWKLEANFLQSTSVGIYLPHQVEFSVSNDGKAFQSLAAVQPDKNTGAKPGPYTLTLATGKLDARARYIRVHARNTGAIPAGQKAAVAKAWLFVDEILVNQGSRRR